MPNKYSLYFATHNPNKLKEIQEMLPATIELVGLSDLGIHEAIPETGKTISQNSALKARFLYQLLKKPCFADDTGLEVPALNNEPGVYSARYAGESANSEENIHLLLKNLTNKYDRNARFVTVITFITEEGEELQFHGSVEGVITEDLRGLGGFGYDPVFLPNGFNRTFAEMSPSEKNMISHRSVAFNKLASYLQKISATE